MPDQANYMAVVCHRVETASELDKPVSAAKSVPDSAWTLATLCGHSHFLRRKVMYRVNAMINMIATEAITPAVVPKPG